MSLFVDERFVNSVAFQLRNFKKKQNLVWNFSCPLCGDSKKRKLKARGYIFRYENRDGLTFKCHNCSDSMSFGEFLKQVNPAIYKEYIYETFLDKGQTLPKPEEEEVPFKKAKDYKPAKPTALIGCPSLKSLKSIHPARAYIEWRKLPKETLEALYWTDDFSALVDRFLPGHQFSLVPEGRIVIPFYDSQHQLIAMQGRSQPKYNAAKDKWEDAPGAIRYITIKSDTDSPRIFGMDRIDKMGRRIYLVEGPFDSMFLPNCGAMAGSDIPEWFPKDTTVVVYDNEPHSTGTVKKISKAIEAGYTVCIWPQRGIGAEDLWQKDINLMVMSGIEPDEVRKIIDRNLYKGKLAEIKLEKWAQCKASGKEYASTDRERYNHKF